MGEAEEQEEQEEMSRANRMGAWCARFGTPHWLARCSSAAWCQSACVRAPITTCSVARAHDGIRPAAAHVYAGRCRDAPTTVSDRAWRHHSSAEDGTVRACSFDRPRIAGPGWLGPGAAKCRRYVAPARYPLRYNM